MTQREMPEPDKKQTNDSKTKASVLKNIPVYQKCHFCHINKPIIPFWQTFGIDHSYEANKQLKQT